MPNPTFSNGKTGWTSGSIRLAKVALHPAADGEVVVQTQGGVVRSANVGDLDEESLHPARGHVALRAGDGEGISRGRQEKGPCLGQRVAYVHDGQAEEEAVLQLLELLGSAAPDGGMMVEEPRTDK